MVVDLIGLAAGSTAEGADAAELALRLFSAFRSLRTTILAIDHVNRATLDEPGKPARPYGSIYKTNLARAMWELRRSGDAIALYHTKSNVSRLRVPIGLRVEYDEQSGAIAYQPTSLDEALRRPVSLGDRIAEVLSNGRHLEPAEIVEELGFEPTEGNKVRATLSRDHRFSRLPSGKYEYLSHAS